MGWFSLELIEGSSEKVNGLNFAQKNIELNSEIVIALELKKHASLLGLKLYD
jgi:hypothetical protein